MEGGRTDQVRLLWEAKILNPKFRVSDFQLPAAAAAAAVVSADLEDRGAAAAAVAVCLPSPPSPCFTISLPLPLLRLRRFWSHVSGEAKNAQVGKRKVSVDLEPFLNSKF